MMPLSNRGNVMTLTNRTTLHDDNLMPFGKHKGQRLGDVPDDYLIWFLRQDWCEKYPRLVDYAQCVSEYK